MDNEGHYHQFKQSWKYPDFVRHSEVIKIPYNCFMMEKHPLFLNNFFVQFKRGCELLEIQKKALARAAVDGIEPSNIEVFQRFSDEEIKKIQKFVLKDNFNKSKQYKW